MAVLVDGRPGRRKLRPGLLQPISSRSVPDASRSGLLQPVPSRFVPFRPVRSRYSLFRSEYLLENREIMKNQGKSQPSPGKPDEEL